MLALLGEGEAVSNRAGSANWETTVGQIPQLVVALDRIEHFGQCESALAMRCLRYFTQSIFDLDAGGGFQRFFSLHVPMRGGKRRMLLARRENSKEVSREMKRYYVLALVAGYLMMTVGCGGGASTTETPAASDTTATAAAPAAPQEPVEVAVDASPDQVISVFLDALRVGDSATTANLLTSKAREETAKHNIAVDPQSAPGAKYAVAPAEFLPDNPHGAHVRSSWTETYQDGTVNYDIVWVLRRQKEGWRIAGMALELVPGQDPAFLNFEDPTDMLAKRDAAIAAQMPEGQVGADGQPIAQPAQQGGEFAQPDLTAQPGVGPIGADPNAGFAQPEQFQPAAGGFNQADQGFSPGAPLQASPGAPGDTTNR